MNIMFHIGPLNSYNHLINNCLFSQQGNQNIKSVILLKFTCIQIKSFV